MPYLKRRMLKISILTALTLLFKICGMQLPEFSNFYKRHEKVVCRRVPFAYMQIQKHEKVVRRRVPIRIYVNTKFRFSRVPSGVCQACTRLFCITHTLMPEDLSRTWHGKYCQKHFKNSSEIARRTLTIFVLWAVFVLKKVFLRRPTA